MKRPITQRPLDIQNSLIATKTQGSSSLVHLSSFWPLPHAAKDTSSHVRRCRHRNSQRRPRWRCATCKTLITTTCKTCVCHRHARHARHAVPCVDMASAFHVHHMVPPGPTGLATLWPYFHPVDRSPPGRPTSDPSDEAFLSKSLASKWAIARTRVVRLQARRERRRWEVLTHGPWWVRVQYGLTTGTHFVKFDVFREHLASEM